MSLLNKEERGFLFDEALFFKDLPKSLIAELISISNVVTFPKNGFVTKPGDDSKDFLLVLSGLIRVNACSSSGKQITYIIVRAGEPYNMLSPFIDTPRILEARAMEKTRCLWIRGEFFRKAVETHSSLAIRIIKMAAIGLDSAQLRILELMEKNVKDRVIRVLNILYQKFGSPLSFTSIDIADIAGTTPESTLRSMAVLREQKIIETQRGKIWIKDPNALEDIGFGNFYI